MTTIKYAVLTIGEGVHQWHEFVFEEDAGNGNKSWTYYPAIKVADGHFNLNTDGLEDGQVENFKRLLASAVYDGSI